MQVLRLATEAGAHMASPAPEPGAPEAATPLPQQLHVTPLAAHVLTELLLHGAPLLAPCLPPPVAALDALRQSSGNSGRGAAGTSGGGEVAALEGVAREMLRLLPVVAAAARACPHELPIEEFLFFGQTPSGQSPAALLAAYTAYTQHEAATEQAEVRPLVLPFPAAGTVLPPRPPLPLPMLTPRPPPPPAPAAGDPQLPGSQGAAGNAGVHLAPRRPPPDAGGSLTGGGCTPRRPGPGGTHRPLQVRGRVGDRRGDGRRGQ